MDLSRLGNISVGSIVRRLDVKYRVARLIGWHPALSPRQLRLLNQMRSDNGAAPPPFRATALWAAAARRFEREFYMNGIDGVETQYFNLRFSGFAAGDERLYDYFLYTYFQLVRERDTLGLLKRVSTMCPVKRGFAYEIEGCRVSLDLLFSIDDLYNLLEVRPGLLSEPLVIADVGAGWGRLGYVLKLANPRLAYVVFDLPESLLISSTYLHKLLPEEPYRSYQDSRSVHSLDRRMLTDGEMWFLGAQDLLKVCPGSLDVVVNIASFQEMTLDQVSEYFRIIGEKAHGGVLYLKQLWSGKTHGQHLGEIAGYEEYPFNASWERLFLRNARFSHYFFEAAFRLE